jgi:clan AA aspartic protease (TIGR02281 family)
MRYFVAITLTAAGWCLGWFSHQWYSADVTNIQSANQATAQPTIGQMAVFTQQATDSVTPDAAQDNSQPAAATINFQQEFTALLAQYDARDLINIIDNLRYQHDPREQAFQTLFKQTLDNWTNSNKATLAIEYANLYLERFYFDRDVMHILANAYIKTQQMLPAIKTLSMLRSHTDASTEVQVLNTHIHQLVEHYHAALEQQQQWPALLDMYDYLLTTDPSNAAYFFQKARVLAQQQAYAEARLALAHVYHDPVLGEKARQLADSMDRSMQGEVRVPAQKTGDSYVIRAQLDEHFPLDMLVDTGASISALSREAFEAVRATSQPTFIDTIKVNTANGSVEAPRYRFKSLELQEATLREVDFIVVDRLAPAQALLGMNVLGQFRFEIDQQNSTLLLNGKP